MGMARRRTGARSGGLAMGVAAVLRVKEPAEIESSLVLALAGLPAGPRHVEAFRPA